VTPQAELYQSFRALHEQDGDFVMLNAWDGTSALLLKQAGSQALGTSSAAIASALGRLDGRHAISREEHICFAALTASAVDAFHRAGMAAGGEDNGPPGLRPNYGPGYYAAFLVDPDGFRLEAYCKVPG
jgi:catechol 2,3-dioxygenase-like lactoylglutathione lyase family enzyme